MCNHAKEYETVVRWVLTTGPDSAIRWAGGQGYCARTHDTYEECAEHARGLMAVNSSDRLIGIFGTDHDFHCRRILCYASNNDPVVPLTYLKGTE